MINECLEQLNAYFNKHGSFRRTLHIISKGSMLEEGDVSHWKDPDTTASASTSTATSASDGPPCKHKIEWENKLAVR